jgi:hypothetical protein
MSGRRRREVTLWGTLNKATYIKWLVKTLTSAWWHTCYPSIREAEAGGQKV